jgi:exosortase
LRPLIAVHRSAAAPRLLSLAVAMGMLGWAYWPNLQSLGIIWRSDPNYSHGVLVIPIALAIFWHRLKDANVDWSGMRGPWWSWLALAAVLVARALAYEWNGQWVENITIIPAAACVMLSLGGWPLLGIGWPAAVFLIFMVPLPPLINNILSSPLQGIATLGSVFIMQVTGLLALRNGNIIYLPDALESVRNLEVAQACNGLSMLMTLAATVTATLCLFPLANWKRIVVLASALPIALVSNIIRIVATGWCYYLIKGAVLFRAGVRLGVFLFLYTLPLTAADVKKLAHDWSGLLMMPLALLLVFLELLVLSWLAADSGSAPEPERLVIPVIPQDRPPPRRSRKEKDRLVLAVVQRDRTGKGKKKGDKDKFPIDE